MDQASEAKIIRDAENNARRVIFPFQPHWASACRCCLICAVFIRSSLLLFLINVHLYR